VFGRGSGEPFPNGGACAHVKKTNKCSVTFANGLFRGAGEPDHAPPTDNTKRNLRFGKFKIGKVKIGQMEQQALWSGDTHRQMTSARISVQHVHGNSLPLRKTISNQPNIDYKPIRIHGNMDTLQSDRHDLWSYTSGMQVRNKIIVQNSQFMCGALLHPNDEMAGLFAGTAFHMLGDTYSRSHVRRVPGISTSTSTSTSTRKENGYKNKQAKKRAKCLNNKMSWIYSMDTVLWTRHVRGDIDTTTWEYECLQIVAGTLIDMIKDGRRLFSLQTSRKQRMRIVNEVQAQIARYMCDHAVNMEPDTLKGGAGGAPREWSASLSEKSPPLKANLIHRAYRGMKRMFIRDAADVRWTHRDVIPNGLTSDQHFKDMVKTIDNDISTAYKNGANMMPHFAYPQRSEGDYCSLSKKELMKLLSCFGDLYVDNDTTPSEEEFVTKMKPNSYVWLLPPRVRDYEWVKKHEMSPDFTHITDETGAASLELLNGNTSIDDNSGKDEDEDSDGEDENDDDTKVERKQELKNKKNKKNKMMTKKK
jgi:hypothetical protein